MDKLQQLYNFLDEQEKKLRQAQQNYKINNLLCENDIEEIKN